MTVFVNLEGKKQFGEYILGKTVGIGTYGKVKEATHPGDHHVYVPTRSSD
jgi:hypothetical protein